jgi:hypothetical protein
MAFGNYNLGVHTLVIYNNSYASTSGWIYKTTSYEMNQDRMIEGTQTTLGEILRLNYGPDRFMVYKDLVHGREYLRYCDEVLSRGFEIRLNGYEYHVFADFEEVIDSQERGLSLIYEQIGKSGVDNLNIMKKRLLLKPLHTKLSNIFSYSMITNQEMLISGELQNLKEREFFLNRELFPAIFEFHTAFMEMQGFIPWQESRLVQDTMAFFRQAALAIIRHAPACPHLPPSILIAVWTLFREIRIRAEENHQMLSELIDKYLLEEPLRQEFEFWIKDKKVQKLLQVHEYGNTRWFNKEAFDMLSAALELVNRITRAGGSRKQMLRDLKKISECFIRLYELAPASQYNYDIMLNELNKAREE